MIRFGPMSIVLLCGALYGMMQAAMMVFIPANQVANRLLAGLIAVLSLFMTPYIIGYAGYYDIYPWLSFAPYKITLAIGPLLYLYIKCLFAGGKQISSSWARHLAPALLQILYYSIIFVQPLAFKNNWNANVHLPYVDPAETLAMLVSLAAYLLRGCYLYRQSVIGCSEWVRNLLVAMGLTLLFWFILDCSEFALSGISYFQRFPFYLWLTILVGYIGTEGYRQGVVPFPTPICEPIACPSNEPVTEAASPDLVQLGEYWRATIIAEQWWRDPELTLAILARRLGTNTTILSRALNDGLGINFNEVINRLRVDAVIAAMRNRNDNEPVLNIALSEGFNSKASFNRAFKQYTGETPTAYRRRLNITKPVSNLS